MDLQQKRMLEKNKKVFILSMVMLLYMCINTAIALSGMTPINQIISVSSHILIIIANIIGYLCFKKGINYKRVIINMFTLQYVIVMIISFGTYPYIYAYLYPLLIIALIYGDKVYLVGGTIFGMIINIGCFVFQYMNGNNSIDFVEQNLVTLFIVLITCICIIIFSNMQNRHAAEDLAVITDKMKYQERVTTDVSANIAKLNETLAQLKEISHVLNTSMDSSNQVVKNIADSTNITAETVQKQTMMSVNIQENIEKASSATEQMQENSSNTAQIVDEGSQMIEDLKKQSMNVKENSEVAKEATVRLNDCIKQVETITGSILNISDQTNLLALNASIEAARAGDAGRGFAVVADQIRSLSAETQLATNQITDIMKQLTEDAAKTTESVEQSVIAVDKQTELTNQTGEKFTAIKSDTQNLTGDIKLFSEMMSTIISSNTQISDSIVELASTSEEVSAAATESMEMSNTALVNLQHEAELLTTLYEIAENISKTVNTES